MEGSFNIFLNYQVEQEKYAGDKNWNLPNIR